MSKQPKLVLRESCVYDLSRDWAPGRFVEMGAGTGHMASLFLARGFSGVCHDLGPDSRAMYDPPSLRRCQRDPAGGR